MTRFAVVCGVLGVLGWVSGCSCGSEETTASPGSPDAGGRGGSGGAKAGSGGSGGKGGAASGTGGAAGRGGGGTGGGSSGTGGRSDAGAVGGSGGTDASVRDAAADSPVGPETGPKPRCPALPDGGLQWRDFSESMCKPCPAATIRCNDLRGTASFNPLTHVLTLHVGGRAEVLTASFTFLYGYPLDAGGTKSGNGTLSGTVDQDTITFDLSRAAPATLTYVSSGHFTLVDACGQTSTDGSNDFTFDLSPNPDGGAPIVNVQCVGI